MFPFNLELAKNHPLITRDGHNVRIISFDSPVLKERKSAIKSELGEDFASRDIVTTIIGVVEFPETSSEEVVTWFDNGRISEDDTLDCDLDLMLQTFDLYVVEKISEKWGEYPTDTITFKDIDMAYEEFLKDPEHTFLLKHEILKDPITL